MKEKLKSFFVKNKMWLIWSSGVIILWAFTLIALFFDRDQGIGDYGKFGDMFGAVNALFSGLDFVGIIVSIRLQSNDLNDNREVMELQVKELQLQRKQLKLQRKELKETRKEFRIQNNTLSFQRFENTFFKMLELHHEIVDKLSYHHGKDYEKRNMIAFAKGWLNKGVKSEEEKESVNGTGKEISSAEVWKTIQHPYENFYYKEQMGVVLSHYFMHIYHVFKLVYHSQVLNHSEKEEYTSIARAQLSQDELYLSIL